MVSEDRDAVGAIVARVGNFSLAEVACALELIDIYLRDPAQKDYRIFVAEPPGRGVCGYVCWGPTPMTRGTYDLYWIATDPGMQGQGIGKALMACVEARIRDLQGRLLIVETSSKDSYVDTVSFYRRLGYREVSRVQDFYDRGDDKLVFEKRFCP
jgi:ribosomal protein S18 acetylase RimI-like enzyme